MKKLIKLGSVAMAVVMLQAVAVIAADQQDNQYAAVYFAEPERNVNATFTSGMRTVVRNERKGLQSQVEGPDSGVYININVEDRFLYDLPDFTPIEVTVEYFDEGNGCFALGYDSYYPQPEFYDGNVIWRGTEIVYLTNTFKWMTYTFYIIDARFLNRATGNDVRIGLWDPIMKKGKENVIFASATIKRSKYRSLLNEISFESNSIGRIYDKDEDIRFDFLYDNKLKKPIVAQLDFKAYDESQKLSWQSKYENQLEPQEQWQLVVEPENNFKYNIYEMEIHMTTFYKDNPDEKHYDTRKFKFSVANIVASEDSNPYYGICQQIVGQNNGVPYDTSYLMNRSGISYVRDEYYWGTAEKSKGVLAIQPEHKEKYKTIAQEGVQVLMIGCYTNSLYDNGGTPSSDEGIQAYANYIGFLAEQLVGIAPMFEIWNEYNLAHFNNTKETPETYAKMVKASYLAIKKANPEAQVVAGGIAQIDLPWTERFLAAGGGEYMDAFSVHPYDWSGEFRTKKLLDDTESLKQLMEKYNVANKPIYFTEIGFGTSPTRYTEAQQAAYTALNYALQRGYDLCEIMTQYKFHDEGNRSYNEHCWGIINYWKDRVNPNGAKKAYLAVCAMNNLMGKYADFKDKMVDDSTYAIMFNNSQLNKNVLFLSSVEGSVQRSYNLGSREVDLYDLYGNYVNTVTSDDGTYNFTLTDQPFYVTGNFSDFQAVEQENAKVAPLQVKKSVVSNAQVEFEFVNNTQKELELVVEDTENFTVDENQGFVDGKATIVFHAGNIENGDYPIRISAVDAQGNIWYSGELLVTIIDSVSVTIDAEPAASGSKTHWRIRLGIKNQSETKSISGVAEVLSPFEEMSFISPKSFTNLKPQEEIVILMNLPERIVKRTFTLEIGVGLSDGVYRSFRKPLDFGEAFYTDTAPKIDGILETGEWNGSWIGADESKDIKEIPDWMGRDDIGFSGVTMWDEEKFYFTAIVTDNIHSINFSPTGESNLWRGDSIQFGLDDRIDLAELTYDAFTEIGMAEVVGKGSVAYRFKSQYEQPTGLVIETAEVAVVRYDAYTVYECAIPWTELFHQDFEPITGQTLRFSVVANDNDGVARRGWIEYTSGIGVTKDSRQFGKLKLVK